MSDGFKLGELDFVALMASRICHDAIGPVGSILNALEVLEEEDDPDVREFALETIYRNAQSASAKLQFARLAYGAAGSAGDQIPASEMEKVGGQIADTGKHTLQWDHNQDVLPKPIVKLALNMLAIALTAIPRGGRIEARITGDDQRMVIEMVCRGKGARVPPEAPTLLTGTINEPLDARTIQPYFTGLLARTQDMEVRIVPAGEETIVLLAG